MSLYVRKPMAALMTEAAETGEHTLKKTLGAKGLIALGIATCLFMMVFLPMDTWIRLLVWMLIGMDIYLVYGAKHSKLGNGTDKRKGMKMARYTGLALCDLLAIVGFLHQNSVGFDTDRTLFYISLVFAVIHLFVYGRKIGREEPAY